MEIFRYIIRRSNLITVGRPIKTGETVEITDGGHMGTTICGHELAERDDFFTDLILCFGCGGWFDFNFEPVPDPNDETITGDPQSPKVSPRKSSKREAGANQSGSRTYFRDESLMISVNCSHRSCPNTWMVWPQNLETHALCPTIHRPLAKMEAARERQRRYRLSKK